LFGWLRSWLAPPVPELDADTDLTDDATAVMQQAAREAARFDHEYIGTEHILLGLIASPGGVADVLAGYGVGASEVRRELERIVQPGSGVGGPVVGRLPLTPRAQSAVAIAAREAGPSVVTSAHLLLGLLREQEGVASQVLINLGLDYDTVRRDVLAALAGGRLE
jgi:ATP-dependent Clp protease ATP-binding subunit ClpC